MTEKLLEQYRSAAKQSGATFAGSLVLEIIEHYEGIIERIRAVQTEMALVDQQADGAKE